LALCSLIVFLPPLIITTGFILTYGQAGLLNQLLATLGLTPLHLMYNKTAVVLAHSYYNIPLAFIVLRTALANIPPRLEDTAKTLGASHWQRLMQLFWPYMRRPLAAIAALIFLYCFTSFIVPMQLGGHQAQTIEVWLYQTIYLHHHYTAAGWVAALQYAVLALIVAGLLWSQPTITTPTAAAVATPLTQRQAPATGILRGLRFSIALFLATPLGLLLVRAGSALTSEQIAAVWKSQLPIGLGRSLAVAACALSLAIVLVWATRLPHWLALSLVAISPITLSFLWFTSAGKGYVSLVGAFVLAIVPICAVIFQTVRTRQPRFLMSTATILGATPWQLRQLDWHLIQPAVRRCVALGSIMILGDATFSALLSPANQPLAMPVVLQFISSYRFAQGSLALALMLIAFTLILAITYARNQSA
jgi:thiamine transport system permease protein